MIIPHNSVHLHFLLEKWSRANSTLIDGRRSLFFVQFCLGHAISGTLTMDFDSSLQHLASSLKPLGLNICPKTWNISHIGSKVYVNIEFEHCTSYQETQIYVISNPAKASQTISASTLRHDKQRWENYIKKWDNQASGPHGIKTKQQLSNCKLNFNVNAHEFKPTSSPVKFPKSYCNIDYEFPYSTCDGLEFLELTDNTNVLKHEFKQTKFLLDRVSKELKSLQESNATQNRCNVELITHVAEVTLELKESKEKITEMKRQEDYFIKQIRGLGTELEKAQSDLRTVFRSNQQRDKQRVLMHGHQGWNVRHGLCHIYMRYVYIYIWVVYSLCFFCCLFITVTWWYVWCFEWASGNQEEVWHVW